MKIPTLESVLREFVHDIETVGRQRVAKEWPDLIVTYNKAQAALTAPRLEPNLVEFYLGSNLVTCETFRADAETEERRRIPEQQPQGAILLGIRSITFKVGTSPAMLPSWFVNALNSYGVMLWIEPTLEGRWNLHMENADHPVRIVGWRHR